jgi:fumarate reductase subunit C
MTRKMILFQLVGIGEVIGIVAFLGHQADLRDPVISGIAVVSCIAVLIATKKFFDATPGDKLKFTDLIRGR